MINGPAVAATPVTLRFTSAGKIVAAVLNVTELPLASADTVKFFYSDTLYEPYWQNNFKP